MGSSVSYITEAGIQLMLMSQKNDNMNEFSYAIYDPTQFVKPDGKTKDIISSKIRSRPKNYDSLIVRGCNTVWKHF